MKLFFKKGMKFLIPFFSFLLILEFIVTIGLRKSEYNEYRDWNLIFDSQIDADVIIQGNSRAWVQISPYILDSILSVNSYNFGIDGHNFLMQYCRYKIYRSRNPKPKAIIQIIGLATLQQREDLYNAQQFLPFIWNKRIRCCTKKYIGFDFLDYHIPAYRYFKPNYQKHMLIGIKEFFNIEHFVNTRYKGFRSRPLEWDSSFYDFKRNYPSGVEFNFNQKAISLMDTFLKECEKDDIRVFLVYSPEYIEAQKLITNRDELFVELEKFARYENVYLLNYSKDSISYSKKYFYNSQHLNRKGAELFSKKLSNDLKRMFEY